MAWSLFPWRRREVRAAAPVETPRGAAVSRLFEAQAVDLMAEALMLFRDPDLLLRQAGLTRADLRILETDDEIDAALETRRSALVSTPWRLEPWEGPAVEWLWAELEPWMERLITGAWRALLYGYSVMEVTYRRDGDRIGIAQIDERPIEWFRPTADGGLRYFPADGSGGTEGVEVDTRFKFLLTLHMADTQNPMGRALLARLYWPWFFRSNGWKFWARFLERHASPLLVGKTVGDVQAMAAALAKAVQSAVVAVGAEDTVNAVYPGSAGDAFDRFHRAINKRIQKAILGQTLTSDVDGGGSYAAAKVHAEVRDDRRMADVRMVTPTVQRLVDALTALNFPAAEPPAFVMQDEAGIDLDRATRDALLVKSGVCRLTEQYLLSRYDFEAGDIEVVAPVSPAAPVQAAARPDPVPVMLGRTRYDAGQQSVEHLIGEAVDAAGQPVRTEAIRKAILAATDPEDLARRLAALLTSATRTEFQETLERALFAADVLGYIAADREG